ncbi:tRNA pseudouridine(55) synthase TruB [Patescibacteria group bacterium]|nr:tRNA pseudouridine(55) synthase TruB [Patescibacteria group bacterium]
MSFLLIDKPAGMTSHGVVARIRRITGEKRVGHSGTLDPFATGLLIIGITRDSTKHLGQLLGMDKAYEAEIVLGQTTETFDPEAEVINVPRADGRTEISAHEVQEAIKGLTGELAQIPPMHSAIKVGGKKLYELARAGKTIEREPRQVRVHTFELLEAIPDTIPLPVTLSVRISCSSGTYIRAIARDLGAALQTGGYLKSLRRTSIGEFSLTQATPLSEVSPENWLDLAKNLVLPSA